MISANPFKMLSISPSLIHIINKTWRFSQVFRRFYDLQAAKIFLLSPHATMLQIGFDVKFLKKVLEYIVLDDHKT